MRWSLATSFLLHAGILAAALVVLPNPDEFNIKPQDSIPVDIISVEDFGKRQATSKTAEPPKPEAKIAPKTSDPVKDVKPAPDVAPEIETAAKQPAAPEPEPEPKKEEPKKVEKKPDEPKPPEKKPEPKKAEPKPLDPDPLKDLIKDTVDEPPPEPKKEEPKKEEVKKAEKKPEKPKKEIRKKAKDLNLDEVADLLNKIDDTRAAPEKPSEETGSPKQGDFNLKGTDNSIAATIVDLLQKRFADCWSIPPASRDAHMSVKVKFQLNQDGTVAAEPRVLNSSADPLFASTAQSVLSAVQGCGPYDFLPKDRYDLWRDNTFDFNPSEMFGT